ncbi:DUF6090 family protein [Polaribacter aquimarinus]|uniref:Uncharacterized protein n=1 Tax=Polaribacter aquimarinus TaxID=2100726 RepID=A0A2U2JDQ1_9FLAO|nr:DUF6090 family protein [Polaribacter aquimarinus]PWG06466.1 hypothetical protein DIS07_01140 [Polaribacter aquimarinus]
MNKFFRKIRQKLLVENRFNKYMLYAIGEIVLVVIGILIALQINNWNEEIKKVKEEETLISQIISDLENNKNELIDLRKRLEINKKGIDSLLNRLQSKNYDLKVTLFLSYSTRKIYFKNSDFGYKMMQNSTTQLISNTNVLKKIVNLYDDDLKKVSTREEVMHNYIDDFQKDFINKYFRKSPYKMNVKINEFDKVSSDLFEPINFMDLSKNLEFINRLHQLKKTLEIRLFFSEKVLSNLNQVLLKMK